MSLKEELLSRVVSRKLTVWLGATFVFLDGYITSSEWVIVTVSYVASQAVVDVIDHLRKDKKEKAEDAESNSG